MERLETESPDFHERRESFRNWTRTSSTTSRSSLFPQSRGDNADDDYSGSYPGLRRDYDELTVLQAQVFLEDAEKYRSIHHKIDKTSLRLYRLYFSRPYQWFLFSVMFVVLILAFFEKPSSLTTNWTSDMRNTGQRLNPPCGLTEGIEIICLLLFVGDVILKSYFKGPEVLKSPWVILYICALLVSVVDWTVSMIYFCKEIVRVRRYIRPFFILQNSSLMKKTVNCLKKTLPEIISILVLLVFHVYFFLLLGMLLFTEEYDPIPANPNGTDPEGPAANSSRNGSSAFIEDFEAGLKNLLVLITTANHPDVMMPLYNYNRFYVLYFIVFLVIGLYCLMNMLTAVIYNHFRGYFLDSMQSSHLRRCVGIRAAYEVLHAREKAQHRYGVSVPLARHTIEGARIAKSTKREMLKELNVRTEEYLDHTTFHAICIIMEKGKKSQKNKPQMTFCQNACLNILQTIVTHRFFTYFGLLVTLVNVVLISIELSTQYDLIVHSPNTVLAVINLVFIIYYTVEQGLRLWAMGWRVYFNHVSYIFDGLITVILVFLEVTFLIIYGLPNIEKINKQAVYEDDLTMWDLVRVINILIILRLFRIIPEFKSMSLVASTLGDLFVNLQAFAGILLVIYYFFAILGMELFAGKLEPAQLEPMRNQCGTYAQLNYWGNNFDDFAIFLMKYICIKKLTCYDPYFLLIFQSMSLVASTLGDLFVNLQAFAGILLVIYYFFAILGMELFAGKLEPAQLEPMRNQCGTYAQLNYWGNNFDDFAASLIVLWDVMVVNNWFVFLDAYTIATGTRWSQLYFVVWWLLSVVLSLNLLSALILENFIMKWEKNRERWRASDQERSRSVSVNSISLQATISRPLSVHDMFRDMLQEPEEEEMLQVINEHRYLRL
ncbi:two pore calcium channel protein 2 [Lingula anatina]|uniref:Two pore calcium channel protein 2 n=1 Tax=Lingula anatina TaxID=7574 RepID=A0A1S3JKD8_LINAN|nr:two pore calcium channel protein 2 [Lingula anatina]|eukprot:XP_013410591.1 two pore calcium channel protein 2 [Lingula anatina]